MKTTLRVLVISTLILSIALPLTAYAGTWQQDSTGWKVQNDNGTYLTNAWYQSPESGLFYYMGADGYMLTSTTTPDGYQVGADGVWIQTQPVKETVQQPAIPSTPKVDSSGQQLAPGALTEEEIERREAEAGMGHHANVEIVTGVGGDADAGKGFDWN